MDIEHGDRVHPGAAGAVPGRSRPGLFPGLVRREAVRPLQSVALGDLGPALTSAALKDATLSVHASFAACEAQWRRAHDEGIGYAFQGFDWLATWQETIGAAEHVVPCIVEIADRNGRCLMILPLGIHREHGLRVLRFLGGLVTDYNAPILAQGAAEAIGAADIERLWAIVLKAVPRFDLVWLRRMPERIEAIGNPLVALSGARHTENAHAANLPASFELFKASRSAKLFADGRRQRKRLSEIGAVRIEVAADAADAAPMLAAMTRQKSRRWLESGSRDLFAVPEYLAFYRKLTKYRLTGEPSGARVHVSSLSVGGEVIATHWGVVFRDRFYYLMPGYEAGSWARYSAGRLLLEDLVRRCIGEGVRVFDLTVGDETYKRDWADHTLLLYEYLRPGTLRGSVFVAWRRLRERLKRNTRLRHRVQQVRARFGTRPRRG